MKVHRLWCKANENALLNRFQQSIIMYINRCLVRRMVMFDTHVHTSFSTDSSMTIEQLKAAIESRHIGAIITEHIDLDCPDKKKFRFNPEEYFKAYGAYRNDLLLLGVELGMGPSNDKENRRIAESYPFDYIIGSIHSVDGMDLYYEDFYINKNKKEAYERYLEVMALEIEKESYFSCLGHIDYICRYARYPHREMYYEDFSEPIDQVLRAVINTGKVLELNTRRLENRAVSESLMAIYKRYHELGGRYATIGSDAHTQKAVGNGLEEGTGILECCGLKPVYFKEGKMEY